jgi:cysteine-rich repeat protein
METSGAAYCGNGQLEAGEACDDGNQVDNDACTNVCKLASCGDGIIYGTYEQCDDGNDSNGDGPARSGFGR